MTELHEQSDVIQRRREFLRIAGLGSGVGALTTLQACGGGTDYQSTADLQEALVADAGFWARSQSLFNKPADGTLNFNIDTGSSKPLSTARILAADPRRGALSAGRRSGAERVQPHGQRSAIARHLGVDVAQLALVNSATDGMMKLLLGLSWTAGDVVVISNQEHPSIVGFLSSVRHIRKIEISSVEIPQGRIESTAAIVSAFRQHIRALKANGKRPRALLWSSPTYVTGTMLPIAELGRLAAENNMISICDAAHLLGMMEFNFNVLHLDYLVTSGSKWQAASHGTGIVVMRREHVQNSPLFEGRLFADLPATARHEGVAAELSWTTEDKMPAFHALVNSLDVYAGMGRSKVSGYILNLNTYLKKSISVEWGEDRIYSYSTAPELNSGLVTFNPFRQVDDVQIEGKSKELVQRLHAEHGMVVRAVKYRRSTNSEPHWPLRVSTPLWISPADIDALIKAIRQIAP